MPKGCIAGPLRELRLRVAHVLPKALRARAIHLGRFPDGYRTAVPVSEAHVLAKGSR